jgi:hypothetical protein
MRYALAGTAALVSVEFLTHAIDTLNMRSKAFARNKKQQRVSMWKLEGFLSLFRGQQAVIYGYALSAVIYFYTYAHLRDYFYENWRRNNQAKIEAVNREKNLEGQN